jgi:hypothetical protein
MFACQRCSWHEVLTHIQAADEHGLVADIPDQARGDGDGLCVIAGNGHSKLAGGVDGGAHASSANCIERANDAGARKQFGGGEPGAFLEGASGDFAVASRKGIAGIDNDLALECAADTLA